MKEEEPKIDESLLTKEQKEELEKKPINLSYLIFVGVIIILMIACIVTICLLNKCKNLH